MIEILKNILITCNHTQGDGDFSKSLKLIVFGNLALRKGKVYRNIYSTRFVITKTWQRYLTWKHILIDIELSNNFDVLSAV